MQWPLLTDANLEAKFIYWPLSNAATKKTLEIINTDGYSTVDLSPLVTDVYAYAIDYRIKDPRLDKREHLPLFTELLYQTTGVFQAVTTNTTGGGSLVCVVTNDNQLNLYGNTTNLTAVQLLQDGKPIADVPVSVNPNGVGLQANLSGYASGVYTVNPVINGNTTTAVSVPFTIYTNTPSAIPLTQEIPTTATLAFYQNYVQLDWTVSADYAALPVNVTLTYTIDGSTAPQTFSATIYPNVTQGQLTVDGETFTL